MVKKLHGETGNAHMVPTFHVGPHSRARKLERRMSVQQFLKEDSQFGASKCGTRTEMNASSEGQVVLRISLWLKLIRILKLVGIAIARGIEEDDLIALLHRDSTQRGIAGDRPGKEMNRIIVAQALLDEGGNGRRVLAQPRLLLGALREIQQQVSRRVHGRLMAGDHKANENRKQFRIGQEPSLNGPRDELRDQVVLRVNPPLIHLILQERQQRAQRRRVPFLAKGQSHLLGQRANTGGGLLFESQHAADQPNGQRDREFTD